MARIQDVAAAANVSKATVSYVFSPEKSALISAETRQKVLAAAQKLGYKPSFIGKALSKQRSYNVALVLPARCARSMSVHLLRIFHGIVNAAESSEYNVSTFFGVSKRFISRAADRRFDGVIAVGLGSDRSALDQVAALDMPLVVLNREYKVDEHTGCIRSDLAGWFLSETDRLLSMNCRSILLLNKGLHADAGRELNEVFASAGSRVKNAGGTLECVVMREDKELPVQLQEVLKNHDFDGIIINGSHAGTIVLKILQSQGKVPDKDIHLSGFFRTGGDQQLGFSWLHDSEEIGRQGWSMLQRMIEGASGEYQLLPVVHYPGGIAGEQSMVGFDI